MTLQSRYPILYLHNCSQISGGERSLLNLFTHLERERFEPLLVVPGAGELSREAQQLGVKVRYLNVPQISPVNMVSLMRTFCAFQRLIREHRIRLIHSYSPRNNVMAALAGRMHNVKVIWHERNIPFVNEPDITRRLIAWPDRVICNSRAVAERFIIRGALPSKARVILNGVNLDDFQPVPAPVREDGLCVGMVANLNKRKGIEFFLDIAAAVARTFENVRFYVIGGEFPDCAGQRLTELKHLAENLGLGQRMIFTDYQPDIRPYLNNLDLFVHVTPKEACSRAILEAMACGKPVIAADDGGNPELIDDGVSGLLINVQDKTAWVKAVEGLLTDDNRRREMGRCARRKAESDFDVRRNARQTQQLYNELLNGVST